MNITIHASFLPDDDPDASVTFGRDIGFEVRSGTFERLQTGDAEVVQEPTEQPFGVRERAFRDPAGNLIRIQELR
jgi:hypothetical protein